jgi:hypothetical protein
LNLITLRRKLIHRFHKKNYALIKLCGLISSIPLISNRPLS